MKKLNLLVLSTFAALALVGCNKAKDGELPSGGKEVDVTTEAGQATLKERMKGMEDAYRNLSADSLSLTSTTSGVNLTAKVDAEMDQVGKVSLDAQIKDVGAKLEAKAAKHAKGEGEEYDSVDAQVALETTSGSVALKGSLPGAKENTTSSFDASLNLKGVKASAYLLGSKVYVDLSDKGNDTFVKGVDEFGNRVLTGLKDSFVGMLLPYILPEDIPEELLDRKELKLTLADYYNALLPEKQFYVETGAAIQWPFAKQEQPAQDEKALDGFVQGIAGYAEKGIGLTFKTYDKKSFGFALAMSKESLIAIAKAQSESEEDAKTAVEQINKVFTKFSFKADVFFNKEGLLESIGATFDIEAKLDKSVLGDAGETFTTFGAEISGKGTEKIALKYGGVKVSFPDFKNFKELKIEQESDQVEEQE